MTLSKCSICNKIPDNICVDNDQGEYLPKAADKLEIISTRGGIRKCPKCSQYYGYSYDHDVTTGAGLGYSDHHLFKMSEAESLQRINRAIEETEESINRKSIKLKGEESFKGEHKEWTRPAVKQLKSDLKKLNSEQRLLS